MKPGHTFAATFIALLALIHPAPASAQFTVCNRTSQDKISLAVAATWYDLDGNGNRQVDKSAEGWIVIAKGTCQVVTSADISRDDIYIFAISTADPAIKWAANTTYCLDPKNAFSYKGARPKPPCSSGAAFPMRYIETSGFSQFTLNLFDNS